MSYTKDELLTLVREAGSEMTLRQKFRLTVLLSIPAIIAQFSFIAMQMIDAAMLGHLSTDQASAVGLVSTTICSSADFPLPLLRDSRYRWHIVLGLATTKAHEA